MAPRATCSGCQISWSASSACHCSGCHQTFSGVTAFDRHQRRGRHLPPYLLGMVRGETGVWTLPGTRPRYWE